MTNLLPFVQQALSTLDSRGRLDAVYTDLSKAFDKVHHPTLLVKLERFGVHGSLLRWLTSYISFRTMCVIVNNFESKRVVVTSGVPQGSHLGPLLFLIFINDISSCIAHSNFLLYADDLKVFKSIDSHEDSLGLQSDLDALSEYCKLNYLSLNVKKCYQITFSRQRNGTVFGYTLNHESIQIVSEVRDLGIIIDSKLTFESHMVAIVQKALRNLGFLKRTCSEFSNPRSVIVLYCSLVRSHLEFSSVIWNPQYLKYIHMVENVQRKFIKYLNYRFNRRLHNEPYPLQIKHYNILSLSNRRLLSDMITLYRIVNGLLDSPFSVERLLYYCDSCNTRQMPLFRAPAFNTFSCRNSPLIRIMRSYNNNFSNIDLFSMSLPSFKKRILDSLL